MHACHAGTSSRDAHAGACGARSPCRSGAERGCTALTRHSGRSQQKACMVTAAVGRSWSWSAAAKSCPRCYRCHLQHGARHLRLHRDAQGCALLWSGVSQILHTRQECGLRAPKILMCFQDVGRLRWRRCYTGTIEYTGFPRNQTQTADKGTHENLPRQLQEKAWRRRYHTNWRSWLTHSDGNPPYSAKPSKTKNGSQDCKETPTFLELASSLFTFTLIECVAGN